MQTLFVIDMYVLPCQQGFCFGFVEFEEASAVQNAIEVQVCLLELNFDMDSIFI